MKSATTAEPTLDALDQGVLDAVVADDPVLRYEIKIGAEEGAYTNLIVLQYQFQRQYYGFMLSGDLTILDEVHRAALAVKDSGIWADGIGRFLGTVR